MAFLPEQIDKAELFYQNAAENSDKIYKVEIRACAPELYDVIYTYGRRGGTLQGGKRNSRPLFLASARSVFNTLVNEKLAKGYTLGIPNAGVPKRETEKAQYPWGNVKVGDSVRCPKCRTMVLLLDGGAGMLRISPHIPPQNYCQAGGTSYQSWFNGVPGKDPRYPLGQVVDAEFREIGEPGAAVKQILQRFSPNKRVDIQLAKEPESEPAAPAAKPGRKIVFMDE